MKRIIAFLLTAAMLLSLMPAAFAAPASETIVANAHEVNGVNRLDGVNPASRDIPAEAYAKDEIVTVIVQLDKPAVLEGFHAIGTDAGKKVSDYLEACEAQARNLKADQNTIARKVGGKVTAQWTSVVNAMALRVAYGKVEELRKMAGVKRAYVEHTYDLPKELPAANIEAGYSSYSYDMVDLAPVWEAGYTGAGMLVAVLDSGLDIEWSTYWDNQTNTNVTGIRRAHEAFRDDSFRTEEGKDSVRYTSATLKGFLRKVSLHAERNGGDHDISYDNNALYKTLKVPFAYDYAGTVDAETGMVVGGDVNVLPTSSEHGTHVSGTVAGYCESDEGEVLFTGIAPDAQVMMMKIFPDDGGSAQESVILNALEDALALGADAINLSLGADNGYADDDTIQNQVYDTIEAAGIVLLTSAGNSDTATTNNAYGGYTTTDDPDFAMMSSPAIYDSNFAVASIDSTVDTAVYFVWTDAEGKEHKVVYNDPNAPSMLYKFGNGNPVRIYPVGGTGTWQDYYNAGFRTSYYDYHPNGYMTGIALVQRGDLSFVDKINNGSSFNWTGYDYSTGTTIAGGVQAVIVYDNVDGALINMSTTGTYLTSAFISKADGEAIVEAVNNGCEVSIVLSESYKELVEYESGGEMSVFTSWGAGQKLELKPEITAPGGRIWSSVPDFTYNAGAGRYDDYTGSYEMMDGTSMAAPHMTGLTTLVEQYVWENRLASDNHEAASLATHLLASTAVPQKDENGNFYSPRQQGAGLANVAAAITTPAYVSVEGQLIGKLELLDDPDWTGSYPVSFEVTNMSRKAVEYNAVATVMIPGILNGGSELFMAYNDVTLGEIDLGSVSLAPGQTVTVTGTIELDARDVEDLKALYPNGTYVEGYIRLTSANASVPEIGLPYLAFLGDWTAAPILDHSTWLDGDGIDTDGDGYADVEVPEGYDPWENGRYTWLPTVIGSAMGQEGWLNLGQNLFDSYADSEQKVFHRENLTLSPNGDGYLDVIDDIELYQNRDAKLMIVEVRDAETDELYYHDIATYNHKTTYSPAYNVNIPSTLFWFTEEFWAGTDLNGNVLPSGTQCIFRIAAFGEGDYGDKVPDSRVDYDVTNFDAVRIDDPATWPTFNGHAMDMTGDVLAFPVTVDVVAPKLENNAVSIYQAEAEDGTLHTYLTGTVLDPDGAIASVEVTPIVTRRYQPGYGDPEYAEVGMDRVNPFLNDLVYDAGAKVWEFTADVTEYAHTIESYPGENYYYNYEWTGNVYISCGDYGGNDRTYAIRVKDSNEQGKLILSQTAARLHVGGEFDLSVIDNTGSKEALVRESSNPAVATIDEYGHIEALSVGQTVITVRNDVDSATCIVAVDEYPTDVVDFNLSLDHFSGLKPNGSLTVKVENLVPSDVVIDELIWDVSEDDETAEYYEGLVTVSKYSSDGMTGEIYLNLAVSEEEAIPGGSGTLSVTINGVKRTMELDWEALYTSRTQDDLISDGAFQGEQTYYITAGETATLSAMYNQLHSFVPVALYTIDGYEQYGYSNPTDPAEGLKLDGPDFAVQGGQWSGKLVNDEGYGLPENIKVCYRYSYGYEYELYEGNPEYYGYYTYNRETGDLTVNAPTGDTTIVVRAKGVEQPGNPAGQMSGQTYDKPDGQWGPFDWAVVGGVEGELVPTENVSINYTTKNVAYFTPAEPGVSYITATSKDGKYSVNMAVICEPVKAETLTLNTRELELLEGMEFEMTATLDPKPSLEKDAKVIWTSYDESVATVDENGVVTAVSEGYAFIKAVTESNANVMSYCIVRVNHEHTIVTDEAVDPTCLNTGLTEGSHCETCGEVIEEQIVLPALGHKEVTDAGKEATCTAAGLTEGVHCERCGEVLTAQEEIPATGHNWTEWEVTTEAECGKDGVETRVCLNCSETETRTFGKDCVCDVFTDVELDVWYHEAVEFVYTNGIMSGVKEDVFAPENSLTRAQMVTILYRMAGSPEYEAVENVFTDVKEKHWFYNEVMWAVSTGLTNGTSADKFSPNKAMTRSEMVTFMARYAKADVNAAEYDLSVFEDASTIKNYAVQNLKWALANGLLHCDSETVLNPNGAATRAEAAFAIMGYMTAE